MVNKNSKLEYITWNLLISLGSMLVVLAINIVVSGIFSRFILILMTYFITLLINSIIRKTYGRDAFSSKRSALHAFAMIIVRASIFATSAVALITLFLSDGDLVMVIEGVTWISLNYLMRYIFVYLVIYFLAYLITAVVLVRV